MAADKKTVKKYEDYLKSLGDALKGVDKAILYEDFMARMQQGGFNGVQLCIHRPMWRGNGLRSGKPMYDYNGGFTLMKAVRSIQNSEEVSKATEELSELGQELVAKMIYDSLQRTALVKGRMQKLTPVFAYVGDDVRAEPVHPEAEQTIAGVHVDFSFSVFADVSINEDLWQQ